MHMLHSKHFFKCNAILEKLAKMQQKTAHNSNTNATAMACNSTLDTLVLNKMRKAEIYRKRTELPSNPKPVTQSCWSIFT